MNPYELIISRMSRDKEAFCDFFATLYNRGICELVCDYRDDDNFSFTRKNDAFGINDISVYFTDPKYFDGIMNTSDGANIIVIITPTDADFSNYSSNWNISKKRQFCKSIESENPISDGITLLDASHAGLVSACTSGRAREYYAMAMEYDDGCYAVIDGDVRSFIATSVTKKSGMIEMCWIYTEPQYRNKGYASELLKKVSDRYASEGLIVTYHCAESNIASAKTALKSGFTETDTEIIFERK